jgi:hypothetical protein
VRLTPDLRQRIVGGRCPAKLVPSLVVASWIVYRFFPFVPTFDLHKYWNALAPVFLTPGLNGYDLFRAAISWLVVCALLEAVAGGNRSLRLFPVFAAGMILARIAIVGKVLSAAEIAGAVTAFALWLALIRRPERLRAAIIAVLLGLHVLSWRLEPSTFRDRTVEFIWTPFLLLMRGSFLVDIQALFEKAFYYGALLWLIAAAGVRFKTAALWIALGLIATSFAQVYWLGGRAQTTDPFGMVAVAALLALLEPAGREAEHAQTTV